MWGCRSSAVPGQPEPTLVALGLGSNSAPERHLLWALAALAHDFAPLRLATPVLGPDALHGGADYVNWVCSFVTDGPRKGCAAASRPWSRHAIGKMGRR